MADRTHITQAEENREEIEALQHSQVEISSKLTSTEGRLGDVESSLRSIQSMLKDALKMKGSEKHTPHDEEGENHSSNSQSMNNQYWPRGVRAELPMFDGQGVEEWVFRVHEYFEVYEVPIELQIRMLSFHLSGSAYTWYHWG